MVENNNYLESRFTPVCVPFSPTFGAKRDVCTTSYFYFSFIVHFMYVCMQYVLFHVYQGGSFLNFIFYSFLSPENNVRNGEKKSSQDLLDVKKYLGVAAGHYEDFTSTFISFTFHSTLQFPKFQSVHTFHISPTIPMSPLDPSVTFPGALSTFNFSKSNFSTSDPHAAILVSDLGRNKIETKIDRVQKNSYI